MGEGNRDPEGARGWLSKKRDDLQSLGRNLTNREMFDYFTKCKIVMECEYSGVIKRHCFPIEFFNDLGNLGWGQFPGKFAKQLRTFENLVNSESRRKKLGKAETYDGTIIPTNQNSNRAPGSRAVNDRQQGKGKSKGKTNFSNFRNGKDVNWTEEVGENNEENYQYEQEEEERENQTEENEDMEVTQARGSREIESDIDWGELDRYTDSEIENHLVSNTQARDFVELTDPRDVEVYKAFGKEQITRMEKERKNGPLGISKKTENSEWKSGLKKITSKYNNWRDRVRKSEERQSALAKSAGLESKGTFVQKRSGWDKEENKAACFERGGVQIA